MFLLLCVTTSIVNFVRCGQFTFHCVNQDKMTDMMLVTLYYLRQIVVNQDKKS